MSHVQKVKVVNSETGSEVFFFDHSFKTAYAHAEEYVSRNKGEFPMRVYYRNFGMLTKFSPLWRLVQVLGLSD